MVLENTSSSTNLMDKEEILTISNSSPLDEHTDSGIENNRSNSNLQSPSTSLDFSPRSDSRQSGYLSGSFSPRYFIRTTSPSVPRAPLTPPPLPPETFQILERSRELDETPSNVGTLLQIDTNKARRNDKTSNLDQVVIGFSVPKKSYGSDYSSAGGRTLNSDSENEFPAPPASLINATSDDLTAKFGRTTPLDSRVDSALPEQDYDSTLSESNSATLENSEHVLSSPLKLTATTAIEKPLVQETSSLNAVKGICLGVELQREQSANITAIKFPLKKQSYSTEKTFKSQPNDKETDDSATETEMTQPHMNSSYRSTTSKEVREVKKMSSAEKKSATTTMKTVDIPFEDRPHSAYRPKPSEFAKNEQPSLDGIMNISIDLGYHTKNPRKYFGFTVAGGKDKNMPAHVETIISNTPAEEAGLKVGDIILTVNGESVEDRYYQNIMRMLREAARLGEVELQIQRPENNFDGSSSSLPRSTIPKMEYWPNYYTSFDEKRAKFNEKIEEQSVHEVQETKKRYQTTKWSSQQEIFEKQKQRDHKPPPTLPKTVTIHRESERHTPAFQSSGDPESRMTGVSVSSSMRSSPISESDYRVTSFHDKPGPGKLADFVPEVERENFVGKTRRTYVIDEKEEGIEFGTRTPPLIKREIDIEEPKVLRNFDVAPTKSIPITIVPAVKKVPEMKQSTDNSKPQLKHPFSSQSEKEKLYWKDFPKSLDFIDDLDGDYEVINYEKETLKKAVKKSLNSSGEDKRVTFGASEIREITPRQTQEIVFPVPLSSTEKIHTFDNLTPSPPMPRLLKTEHFESETKNGHEPVERIHSIKLSGKPDPEGRKLLSQMGAGVVPATYYYASSHKKNQSSASTIRNGRSCSFEDLSNRIWRNRQQTRQKASDVTWNGHEGVKVIPQTDHKNIFDKKLEESFNSDRMTRQYMRRSSSPSVLKGESRSASAPPTRQRNFAAPELVESVDSKEWRQFIEEQRYPSGAPATKTLPDNDPKFRIVHSTFANTKETSSTASSRNSSLRHLPYVGITETTRLNKAEPSLSTSSTGNPFLTKSNPTNKNEWLNREAEMPYQQTKSRNPSATTPLLQAKLNEWNNENVKSEDPVVAVTGKHRCSHCQMELGQGAAMIIESLNLFYHLSCFRCYVCNAALGNGTHGADVRVRDSKLHCQNCYCNEEAGLKFSQV